MIVKVVLIDMAEQAFVTVLGLLLLGLDLGFSQLPAVISI